MNGLPQTMQPVVNGLQTAGNQPPLNPMLLLQGLTGMSVAGQPGPSPAVQQAFSQYAGNPATAAMLQRRG